MTVSRIRLTPIRTSPAEPAYQEIFSWAFAAQPFFEGQVARLLHGDIPQRVRYGCGLVWVYRDPVGRAVGFGTLDICREYEQFTNGKHHPYIPLLAVHPSFRGLGYG